MPRTRKHSASKTASNKPAATKAPASRKASKAERAAAKDEGSKPKSDATTDKDREGIVARSTAEEHSEADRLAQLEQENRELQQAIETLQAGKSAKYKDHVPKPQNRNRYNKSYLVKEVGGALEQRIVENACDASDAIRQFIVDHDIPPQEASKYRYRAEALNEAAQRAEAPPRRPRLMPGGAPAGHLEPGESVEFHPAPSGKRAEKRRETAS